MAPIAHCCDLTANPNSRYIGSRGRFTIMASNSKHISLPKPLVDGDPTDWFVKYEICCVANEWGDEVKAKKFPTLLEGEALAVWLELSEEQRGTYATAKAKITKAMAPIRFVSLDDFRARKLLPNEALHVFLHELRQLLKQAIPEASDDTRKQLLLHQFVSGLPASISKQLRATGEVNDLDVVMERAKLLMIIEEPQKVAAIQTTEIQDLKEQISLLTEQVAALSVKPLRQPSIVVCYKCQQPGHVQRNCPSIKRCYLCGQAGHVVRQCPSGNGQGVSQRGQRYPRNN